MYRSPYVTLFTKPFAEALREATTKLAAKTEEKTLAYLRARYPELADKVVEGELTLEGATAEADA